MQQSLTNNPIIDNTNNNLLKEIDKEKSVKHRYGEYKNVLLTDAEMEKLKAEFPKDYQERIERLSDYIASKGVSYKSHLATIRVWAKKDKQTEVKTKSAYCMETEDIPLPY